MKIKPQLVIVQVVVYLVSLLQVEPCRETELQSFWGDLTTNDDTINVGKVEMLRRGFYGMRMGNGLPISMLGLLGRRTVASNKLAWKLPLTPVYVVCFVHRR